MNEEKTIIEEVEDDFDLLDFTETPKEEKKVAPKVSKKTAPASEKAPVEKKKASTGKSFTYPFTLHYAGRNLDISHIFVEGKTYTEAEITKAMLQHQFYEFSGDVSYDYIESDNVLVPIFKQHKKG